MRVTELIRRAGLGPDFSVVSPEVLQRASELGTYVHEACRMNDEGDLDESSIDDSVKPYLDAYRQWKIDNYFEAEKWEIEISDRGLVGHPDIIGALPGMKCLVEIKTCEPHPSHKLQLAAYWGMSYYAGDVWKPIILYLKKDGKYRSVILNEIALDWQCILAAKVIAAWKEHHGIS